MKPPEFEYARPASVAEAVATLASAGGEGKVLAGGQSLVPLLNFRLAAPTVLVDVNRIEGLAGIRVDRERLSIGATTRTRALELDPAVRRAIPILADAARWVGHVQIRNRGTVGGSIAHADPAAEIPAIALLLEANLVAAGPAGERTIPADAFFAGFLTTTLAEDELLTEVRFSLPAPETRWGFREFAQRRGDFALAGAAVAIRTGDERRLDDVRIVGFGTADRPNRARRAEEQLTGRPADAAALEAAAAVAADELMTDDPRPDAAYRRRLTETMVRRALEDAAPWAAPAGDRREVA